MEERVATLNIKNLPDRLYKKLQARAKRERRSVAQEVTHLLDEALDTLEALSILELRGLTNDRRLPNIPGLQIRQLASYLA